MTILIQTAPVPGEGTYEVGLTVLGDYDAEDISQHAKVSSRRYPTELEAAGAALAAARQYLEQQGK